MKRIFLALFMVLAMGVSSRSSAQDAKEAKEFIPPQVTNFDGQAFRKVDEKEWYYGNVSLGMFYSRTIAGGESASSLGLFGVGSVRTNFKDWPTEVLDVGAVLKLEYASFESSIFEGAINRFFIGAEIFYGDKTTKTQTSLGSMTLRLMYGQGKKDGNTRPSQPGAFDSSQTTNYLSLEGIFEYYWFYKPVRSERVKVRGYSVDIPEGWFHAGILQINLAFDVGGKYSDNFGGEGESASFYDFQLTQFIYTQHRITTGGNLIEDAYGVLIGYFDDTSTKLVKMGGVARFIFNREIVLMVSGGIQVDNGSRDSTPAPGTDTAPDDIGTTSMFALLTLGFNF